jgi:nucleotide-binding universal stress UspA family protein
MGSHGSDGLKEIFVGSNAEKVVRNADIPVLVIKEELNDFKVDRFVFASDFKDEGITAFEKAKAFAEMLSATLDLVYINTPGDDFLSTKDAYERINHFLMKAKVGKEVKIYNDYTVENGILNYSMANGADAIGIPTHGRKGLSHFFMGSIGEDIANHSKIPVVTFKI